jgi:hypothetical protein
MNLKGNPTLLSLLSMGCRITLPDGRWLDGDTTNKYIGLGCENVGSLGSYDLSRDGLKRALDDRDFQKLCDEGFDE